MNNNRKRLKQLGFNHKKLRESFDPIQYGYITQKELSNMIKISTGVNISSARISNFESGKLEPSKNELLALQKFYNVSTDFLLGFTDNMSSDYEVLRFSKDLGLSDNAMQVLRNIRENKVTNGIINKILCSKNGILFESILFNINKILELTEIPFYKANNGDKLNEARKRYKQRTGKDATIDNDDFILNDLNNLTTEQNNRINEIKILKFNINESLNKIIDNIVNKRC